MLKNRTGRKLLEQRYGKGCFIERAGIRVITPEQESKLRKIKGFKRLNRRITYHHLVEKHLGGEVSISNGANIAAYNHEWLHRQSPEVIEQINEQLQQFKLSIDMAKLSIGDEGLEVEKLGCLDFSMDDTFTIPVYDISKEDWEKKKKFNRAKEKRETMQMIEEELYR